jgi:hypothetical protein
MKSRASLMRVDQTRGILMGRITDVSLVPPLDILWNHYGGPKVQTTGCCTAALRWPQRGIRTQNGTSSEEPHIG